MTGVFTRLSTEIWRKFNTDGVQASGRHEPDVDQIKLWGTELETQVNPTSSAFRNLVTAGDFTKNPWQMGTSFSLSGSTSYTADGSWAASATGAGAFNVLKTADAPTIAQAGLFSQHCYHVDVTTADASLAATDRYFTYFALEGLDTCYLGFGQAGALSVTVKFAVKAAKAGIHCISLLNSAGNRSYVKEYTVNVADTWEIKTVTFPGDTTGTWLYTAGSVGLFVIWSVASGSNFRTTPNSWTAGNFDSTSNQVNEMDSTANNFKLQFVSAEVGSVASAFENLDEGTILRRCQRYLSKSFPLATAPAQALGAGVTGYFEITSQAAALFGGTVFLPVRMCKAPTLTTYNPVSANANWRDLSNSADRSVSVLAIGENFIQIGSSTNGVASAQNYIHWLADARL